MATVHYDTDCRDGFDDAEDGLGNPFAVADSEHSDVVRAATEYDVPRGQQEGLPKAGIRRSVRPAKSLHRIAEVRQRQGVTLRNVARRLGVEISVVRRQEQPDCDVRVSDLMKWQEVLEVPVSELLVESEGQLSGPVLERARMVKLMKTAAAIREQATAATGLRRMADMLVEQVLEIMPELADVTPWHHVGQRRTLNDVGRTARCLVSEDLFRRQPGE